MVLLPMVIQTFFNIRLTYFPITLKGAIIKLAQIKPIAVTQFYTQINVNHTEINLKAPISLLINQVYEPKKEELN